MLLELFWSSFNKSENQVRDTWATLINTEIIFLWWFMRNVNITNLKFKY